MLQDNLCQQACFVSSYELDECQYCAPDCFTHEVFVREGDFPSEGTLSHPYESLMDAFFAISQPVSVVYLLGERVAWGLNETITLVDFQNVSLSRLRVQSLLCTDRNTDGCSSDFTEIDITGSMSVAVSFELVFERVVFTSKALFADRPMSFCPFLQEIDGKWVDAGGNSVGENTVGVASVCAQFGDLSLFRVKANGSLILRVLSS